MDTQVLLDKLTKAVSFKFKTDKTAPGVTIAVIKSGYYCSVVRYDGAFAKGKEVVCSARGTTLQEALEGVAREFLAAAKVQADPLQDLNTFVGSV